LISLAAAALSGCGAPAEHHDPVPEDQPATYVEPKTGRVFELNPNRRVVLGPGAEEGALADPQGDGDLGTIRQPINTGGSSTDATNSVQIQMVECASQTRTGRIAIGCSVGPEFFVVGGGAEDVWTGDGALLTTATPSDFQTFIAESKDHASSAQHRLHVWAIGIRVRQINGVWLTRDQLFPHIFAASIMSNTGPHVSAACGIPTGYSLLGGGVETLGNRLITASLPASGRTWFGAAKDHIVPDHGEIFVSCIGIRTTIPGVGTFTVFNLPSVNEWVSTGIGRGNVGIFPGSVLTSFGGEATWAGVGRMLYKLGPPTGDLMRAEAWSKDHLYVDNGFTRAWATQIRRQ